MAVKSLTRITQTTEPTDELEVFFWEALANGDSGEPLHFGHYADRSIQVLGNFGAGGNIVIEGSIDGTTYATLHDVFGNSLTITSAGIYQIAELVLAIRPSVVAGAGVDLDIYSLNRRHK